MMRLSFLFFLAFTMTAGLSTAVALESRAKGDVVGEGAVAPEFVLKDVEGKEYRLESPRSSRQVIFFFCGCAPCQECSRLWGEIQRGGVLAAESTPESFLKTWVVYLGDADGARLFARMTGLDAKQTILLPDPKMEMARAFDAVHCPRVFVTDGKKRIVYTNAHADDRPDSGKASVIVSRIIDAVRSLEKNSTTRGTP